MGNCGNGSLSYECARRPHKHRLESLTVGITHDLRERVDRESLPLRQTSTFPSELDFRAACISAWACLGRAFHFHFCFLDSLRTSGRDQPAFRRDFCCCSSDIHFLQLNCPHSCDKLPNTGPTSCQSHVILAALARRPSGRN